MVEAGSKISFPYVLTGVAPSATGFAVSRIIESSRRPVVLLLCENLGRAEGIAEEIPFHARQNGKAIAPRIKALPPSVSLDAEGGAFDAMCDLLTMLSTLRHEEMDVTRPLVIACTPEALSRPCPLPSGLDGRELLLRRGQQMNFREFVERLAKDFDYDCEAVCDSPGQFAVRGGLVDVYPLNAQAPVRIDFFGDEIEAIRMFDPMTQRSESVLESVIISAPVAENAELREGAFLDYLPEGVLWLWVEPGESVSSGTFDYMRPPGSRAADTLAAVTEFDAVPAWVGESVSSQAWDSWDLSVLFTGDFDDKIGADRLSAEENLRERLLTALARWQYAGATVRLVGETEGSVERLKTIVADTVALWKTAPAVSSADDGAAASKPAKKRARSKKAAKPENSAPVLSLLPPEIPVASLDGFAPEFVVGLLTAGFVVDAEGRDGKPLVIATERELFGRHRRRIPSIRQRRLPHKSRVEQLLDFNELVDGDALVHLQHGVCLYRGISAMEFRGRSEEMISLEFDNGITTHLPLREAHLLSRYVGLRKVTPKLGKIGSNTWEKTRRAAETATIDFAADLLGLHARRQARPGICFPLDEKQPWLHEFEQAFPHRETPDQQRAIDEAKRDMEKASPMDRLICGDVGYGKTEVALRAAFKAVLAGYQVAILAPTTILVQQHFNTFRDRFSKYPLSVEMLSRFRSPSKRAQIISQINDGRVDIVIGTHALLANTIKFPKLGLLVIDEEHRFGVRQKELIKKLRENVDVLCMSATPIPRTLYLALMGARDLSVIETPPRERLPIRTVVRAYDPKLVQEAIRYEVGRGGQVFYLHNRVETIDTVAAQLRELVPEVSFGVGHGQMHETELEAVMTEFVAGKFDVLVCTTIIETGLDIPNCNTLIIEGADRFGLAQLYQLRGRVGRFNRQAYAYLLLHKHASMLDPARRRLSAIRQHNQLGAGFRIAMRDLELRGTGNLLGREQSGHIAGVGFDLYCQLLRQSIARMKGEPAAKSIRAEIRLDFVQYNMFPRSGTREDTDDLFEDTRDLDPYRVLREDELDAGRCADIVATLPPEYISDTRLRIDIFRRLAMAPTVNVVREVAADLVDRFGRMPPSAEAFVALAEMRCLAESRGVVSVETEGSRLKCKLAIPRRDGSLFIKVGANFPRLTMKKPMQRIQEIKQFLIRQPLLTA
ncbi:MAG: DEAD/DEAH box helicase [Puniceicoccales bacterium]|nr:DEAD/DEAH box helicase [Puniceicoccales bacterium]